jgi:hypothetical protein|tara:strand:- start:653 stop:997 length:345 start_codon:yes stop_codon:yes gene_type:complete
MVLGIQIIGILFSAFMIYYTYLHFKKNQFTAKETSFWILLWVAFLAVTLYPQMLDPIVSSLRLARTLDLFVILGFMFLIAAVVYSYTIVRMNQKRIDDIVREVAHERAQEPKNK